MFLIGVLPGFFSVVFTAKNKILYVALKMLTKNKLKENNCREKSFVFKILKDKSSILRKGS